VRVSLKSVKITLQNPKLGSEARACRFSKFQKKSTCFRENPLLERAAASKQAASNNPTFSKRHFFIFFTRHAKLFKGNEHWYDRNIPGCQVRARRELEVGNLKKYRIICECKVLQGCKQLCTFDVRALYF